SSRLWFQGSGSRSASGFRSEWAPSFWPANRRPDWSAPPQTPLQPRSQSRYATKLVQSLFDPLSAFGPRNSVIATETRSSFANETAPCQERCSYVGQASGQFETALRNREYMKLRRHREQTHEPVLEMHHYLSDQGALTGLRIASLSIRHNVCWYR